MGGVAPPYKRLRSMPTALQPCTVVVICFALSCNHCSAFALLFNLFTAVATFRHPSNMSKNFRCANVIL